jgi:hypothetical protein
LKEEEEEGESEEEEGQKEGSDPWRIGKRNALLSSWHGAVSPSTTSSI